MYLVYTRSDKFTKCKKPRQSFTSISSSAMSISALVPQSGLFTRGLSGAFISASGAPMDLS
jgi:hypothetical protein